MTLASSRCIRTNNVEVAWPAGNSGLVSFFEPQNGESGSLAIELVESSSGHALDPVYEPPQSDSEYPTVGVTGQLSLNSSATLVLSILGSVRSLRDYIEGPKILQPIIQDAIVLSETDAGGFVFSRLWLDNVTTTTLSFTPSEEGTISRNDDDTLNFDAGVYNFNASFDFPQLDQLSPEETLAESAHGLITENPELTQSLSFMSYTDKIITGAWRFLTYFGRDSMISLLLMGDILSPGENGSFEAGLRALLERIDKAEGTAAHEETIGDYATWLNLQAGIDSTDPVYDYKMIDTDFFLPIVLAEYFIKNPVGRERMEDFLALEAVENPDNAGLTYRELATLNAEKIMRDTAAFASEGGQVQENLIRLREGEIVGEWRDSAYGIGGGRIPYNVNTAIAPAGLRAIAALADAGFFPDHPDWAELATEYAQVWEDETLHFFEVTVPEDEARLLVEEYVETNGFPFPSETDSIDGDVHFYGLALEGNINNQDTVRVLNTDDCFRHFLLNTTNQTQLSSFVSQTADHILAPYPVGLTTDVGLLVANPAYGGQPSYSANFTNTDYHGTVVWGWQLAMMAKGLEHQLGRCAPSNATTAITSSTTPDFCADEALHSKVVSAYNRLWDVIDANTAILSGEVWSWRYVDGEGFVALPLGELSATESNIRQLWSLTFLAVRRNEDFR